MWLKKFMKHNSLKRKICSITLTVAMVVTMMFGYSVIANGSSEVVKAATTGTYDEWKTGTTYAVGDFVVYEGVVYECIMAHTSHDGWKPTDTGVLNILWKERSDLENVPAAQPVEVTGLKIASQNGAYVEFVWSQTQEQIDLGQSYKVYIDNKLYGTYASATQVAYTFTTNGTHSIKVTAYLNKTETTGQTVSVTVSGLVEQPTEAPTQAAGATTGLSSRLMSGYYHTWDNSGNPFIKLRDVDENWDVINISFAEPISAGSTDGKMQLNISGLSDSYTKDDFKQDVKDLQAKGKKIVLSIGGYEGYFSLTSDAAVNQFVSDIKSIIDEYGFDGIDIDLEQSSVQFDSGNDPDINNPTSPKIVNMIKAVKTIHDSYDDDFILSWAPETFYVQLGYTFYGGINAYCDSRSGVYLPMINALREETSFVQVQLYNSSAMNGLDGTSYTMGTKEGIVAMCEMLLKGFYVNSYYGTTVQDDTTYFAPLRPDQVVIAVPSSAGAAGSGQISNSELQSAFTELDNAYPGIRGIMAWSINWDSVQNNNSFVQENAAYLASLKTEAPTEVTTKEPTTEAPTTAAPVTGDTSAKVEINGYQISTIEEGFRTVYSIYDPENEVVSAGMLYGIGTVTESDMTLETKGSSVYDFVASDSGKMEVSFSQYESAQSYSMTMKFAKSVSFYNTKMTVRAYAQLADGSYIYSDIKTYTVYKLADYLYQNLLMNSLDSHEYLYNNILSVVDSSYKVKDFAWNNSIVKPGEI